MDKIKKILIIIPAYNESESIIQTVNNVKHYFRAGINNHKIDYIVINDGSTDQEEEVLKQNNIKHLTLVNNLGIGGAVQTGYLYAYENNFDIAVQFDGDGQHDIYSLDSLISPIINEGVDFVVGSRFVADSQSEFKSNSSRQVGIKLLSRLIKLTTPYQIKDVTSGFRACNRGIIEQFAKKYPMQYPEPESYLFLCQKNFKVKEVGVNMFERNSGQSSITFTKAVGYMLNVSMAILITSLFRKG